MNTEAKDHTDLPKLSDLCTPRTFQHLNPIIEESDGDWGSIPGEVRVSELRGYESVPDRPADVTFYIGEGRGGQGPRCVRQRLGTDGRCCQGVGSGAIPGENKRG